MECTVASKLTRDLEDREIMPANQGVGVRWGGCQTRKMYMEKCSCICIYKGFQRKEQKVAVAIDLTDAYNRAQFKLLMDLLI